MPGNSVTSQDAQLRRDEAHLPKALYAIDARITAQSPVTDVTGLAALAPAAVTAGGGHVLGQSHAIFPNGAVTLVLILAESHLSVHTWPEQDLIAIDLFSCGSIDADQVIGTLVDALALTGVTVRQLPRGVLPSDGQAQ